MGMRSDKKDCLQCTGEELRHTTQRKSDRTDIGGSGKRTRTYARQRNQSSGC